MDDYTCLKDQTQAEDVHVMHFFLAEAHPAQLISLTGRVTGALIKQGAAHNTRQLDQIHSSAAYNRDMEFGPRSTVSGLCSSVSPSLPHPLTPSLIHSLTKSLHILARQQTS